MKINRKGTTIDVIMHFKIIGKENGMKRIIKGMF